MRLLSLASGVLLVSSRLLAQAPVNSVRMVLTTETTCHALPDDGSASVERYHAGAIVHSSKSALDEVHRIWYVDSRRVDCWVLGAATVAYDPKHPELAYAAIVDHLLARTDDVSFADYAEIQNLLEARDRYDDKPAAVIQRFPLVRFKSLLLIDKALGHFLWGRTQDDPGKQAWVNAHKNQLYYFEPDGAWYLLASEFWALHDQNKDAPWADDLAWAAARRPQPSDECGADCFLSKVADGPQMYWARHPAGTHIMPALALADTLAAYAIKNAAEDAPTRAMIDSVRVSLARVTAPGKAHLLDQLAKLDRLVKPSIGLGRPERD
jgi:hypothetical protein